MAPAPPLAPAENPGQAGAAEALQTNPPFRPPSQASLVLAARYAQTEATLVGRGLLRTDAGQGLPLPDDAQTLRDFRQIAFGSDGPGARATAPQQLTKWRVPVRLGVTFGAGIPPDRRRADRAEVARYAGRLARVTGHDIALAPDGAVVNFHVLYMTEDDRAQMLRLFETLAPGLDRPTRQMLRRLPRSVHCLVVTFAAPDDPAAHARAVALIRGEHPPLSRRACLHEELAQGLGLPADSETARPSIFNDDDEFALLTRHDERLLRILYDPRLVPGMTAAQALPQVEDILAEASAGPV